MTSRSGGDPLTAGRTVAVPVSLPDAACLPNSAASVRPEFTLAPVVVEEPITYKGETFDESMSRQGIGLDNPARASLYKEFVQCSESEREHGEGEGEAEVEVEEYWDEDGAIFFDGGSGEVRGVRLPRTYRCRARS